MEKEHTFVEITNQDIYKEVQSINKKLDTLSSKQKVVNWLSGSALSISTFTIILFIQYVMNKGGI